MLIILVLILIYIIIYGLFNKSNTKKDTFASMSSSKSSSSKSSSSKLSSSKLSPKTPNNINSNNNILFNNKDYNENLSVDNKDLKHYENDMIDDSKINETDFNIIYSIDPIDYSDVETGIQKCYKDCKGTCFEMGYTGVATCYPMTTNNFDYGTLYKNPTFTYGYNAY